MVCGHIEFSQEFVFSASTNWWWNPKIFCKKARVLCHPVISKIVDKGSNIYCSVIGLWTSPLWVKYWDPWYISQTPWPSCWRPGFTLVCKEMLPRGCYSTHSHHDICCPFKIWLFAIISFDLQISCLSTFLGLCVFISPKENVE